MVYYDIVRIAAHTLGEVIYRKHNNIGPTALKHFYVSLSLQICAGKTAKLHY